MAELTEQSAPIVQAPDPKWVTSRRQPEYVIAEAIWDGLRFKAPELFAEYPRLHRDIAAEACARLGLREELPHQHTWAKMSEAQEGSMQLWYCGGCARYDALPLDAGAPPRG